MIKLNRILPIWLSATLLTMLSFVFNQWIIAVPAAAVLLAILFCKDSDEKMMHLLYFLPFSLVFKLSPGSTSFFTFFEFAYVAAMGVSMLREKRLSFRVAAPLAAFMAYVGAVSFINDAFSSSDIVKLGVWLIILYFAMEFRKEGSLKNYTIAYAAGLASSSVCGLFIDAVPNIKEYIKVSTIHDLNTGEHIDRFGALWNDPNMMGVFLLMGIALLLVLGASGQLKYGFSIPAAAVLAAFGLLSLSKLFLIGLAGIVLLFMAFKIREKKGRGLKKLAVASAVAAAVLAAFVYFDPLGVVDTYVYRFTSIFTGGDVLSKLTTKRSEFWGYYFEELKESGKWIFGNGISPSKLPHDRAAHNTLIQVIYLLGIVGTGLYAFALSGMARGGKFPSAYHAIPPVVLFVSGLALDLFKHDFFTFMLLMCFLCWTAGNKSPEKQAG